MRCGDASRAKKIGQATNNGGVLKEDVNCMLKVRIPFPIVNCVEKEISSE